MEHSIYIKCTPDIYESVVALIDASFHRYGLITYGTLDDILVDAGLIEENTFIPNETQRGLFVDNRADLTISPYDHDDGEFSILIKNHKYYPSTGFDSDRDDTIPKNIIFKPENKDMVNHPDHYQTETGLEVIDIIEACVFDLKGIEATDTGNIIKYMARWKKKNGLQDLKKAKWYLEHLIAHVEKIEEENK